MGYSTAFGGLVAFDINWQRCNAASIARSYANGPGCGNRRSRLIGELVGYSVSAQSRVHYATGTTAFPLQGNGNAALAGDVGQHRRWRGGVHLYSTGVVNLAGSSCFGGFVGSTVGLRKAAPTGI